MIKGLKDLQDLHTQTRPIFQQVSGRVRIGEGTVKQCGTIRPGWVPLKTRTYSRADIELKEAINLKLTVNDIFERNLAIPSILKILVLDLRIKSKRP